MFEEKEDKSFSSEKRAGLYLTISFHLVIIIISLCYGIKKGVEQETSFVLDFTRQEELEKEEKLLQMKEEVSREVDELIAQARKEAPRNVAVDASRGRNLKDDRHKNPSDVYDQARRLQDKLDASKRAAQRELDTEEDISLNSSKDEKNTDEQYSGPSVLSWRLDGRKALKLPIPTYKCEGAGDISVAIVVDRKGAVKAVRIIEEVSSTDECLQEYALIAARKSRFNSSDSAPERQAGEIVYRFIAQ